jgi:phage/plasmid-like protein (TIGR03299 family)
MSRETVETLNTHTLIGYASKRGKAWHYKAAAQGVEPNHYPGAIPVEDVRRRLFDWDALEGTAESTVITPNGVIHVSDPTRKSIVRVNKDMTASMLGIFKSGYRIHEYDQWLIHNVENILDAHLAVGSAGLLAGGARAWVQVEMEDTLEVQGIEFRPFLTAATSMDGSMATQYVTGAQVVVCDNTLSAAVGSQAQEKFKVKHSRFSLNKISDVREALGIIYEVADAFTEQVNALLDQSVTDTELEQFLEKWAGTESDTQRSKNMAARKQGELRQLWNHDERVTPWKNTAYGVLAMVNTYGHHIQTVKNVSRAERNAENAITGQRAKEDREAMEILAGVLN